MPNHFEMAVFFAMQAWDYWSRATLYRWNQMKSEKKIQSVFFLQNLFFREHALFLTHASHRIEWEHCSTTNLVVAENWSRQSLHCTQVKFFKKHSSAVAISNTTECEWRFCVTWTVLWIPNSKCSIRYEFCLEIFDINILAFLWSSTAPPLFWWSAFLQYFYLSLLISSVFDDVDMSWIPNKLICRTRLENRIRMLVNVQKWNIRLGRLVAHSFVKHFYVR